MPGLLFILFDEYSTFGVGFGGGCLGLRIGSNVNLIGNYLDRGCCHEEDARTRRNLLCATGISRARCKRTISVGSTTARDIPVPRACRTRVPCQFSVRTGASPISFALPSGERRELAGITPVSDKYCVCDPGPVTPDCTAPQIDHWCLGFWADVAPGLNPPR
jgi:hypothetical protein